MLDAYRTFFNEAYESRSIRIAAELREIVELSDFDTRSTLEKEIAANEVTVEKYADLRGELDEPTLFEEFAVAKDDLLQTLEEYAQDRSRSSRDIERLRNEKLELSHKALEPYDGSYLVASEDKLRTQLFAPLNLTVMRTGHAAPGTEVRRSSES